MSSVVNDPIRSSSQIILPSPFSKTVDETINLYRAKFRENIGLESVKILEADQSKTQIIGHYIHQKLGANSGKIGSLVKIEFGDYSQLNKMEEIVNSLARQVVALNDPQLNLTKLMNSDYLFATIGTVRDFIEFLESKLKSKITLLDMNYVKIK